MANAILTTKDYGKDARPVPVKDANGRSIREGDFVQLTEESTWLPKGAIVEVMGAQRGDLGAWLHYRDSRGHRSSVRAGIVVVSKDEETPANFERAFLLYRLSNLNASAGAIQAQRTEVTARLRQLGVKV